MLSEFPNVINFGTLLLTLRMTTQEIILAQLGLQTVMTDIDRQRFQVYVPRDYPGSERAQMDEVYRMSEIILVHPETGLRLEYLVTENYDGDVVRYRFRSLFIITHTGDVVDVVEIDVEQQCFKTSIGRVLFSAVKRDPQ